HEHALLDRADPAHRRVDPCLATRPQSRHGPGRPSRGNRPGSGRPARSPGHLGARSGTAGAGDGGEESMGRNREADPGAGGIPMKADLVVTGGRLVDHRTDQYGAIAVADGRIVAIGDESAMPDASERIDATGMVVMPGVVDPHCHLGVDFGYDEDMRTETAAAARGGVTTILLHARHLNGPYVPYYADRRKRGEAAAVIDFGFHFGIQRPEHVDEIPEIAEHTGVQSFKCHMGYEPGNSIGIVSSTDDWVFGAMREAAKIERGVVSVHCENTHLVGMLKEEAMESGREGLAAYSESRPPFVEE